MDLLNSLLSISNLGIDSVEEIIMLLLVILITFMLSIGLVFINRWLKAKAGIAIFQNEEQMRSYLIQAIVNGFFTVIKNNNFSEIREQKGDTVSAVKEYVKQTSPETLKRLKINTSSDVLDKLIISQINQIVNKLENQDTTDMSAKITQKMNKE